jgi:hypothetical protein
MRRALILHPDSVCTAVTSVDVEIVRGARGDVALRYLVTGALNDVAIPALAAPVRSDGLWQHTCFEAFARPGSAEEYCEFNFAPSRAWAAYRFSGYREGMREEVVSAAPVIEVGVSAGLLEIRVAFAPERGLTTPSDGRLRLGLSAVIEETNGGKSYWALAHPPGKADFHHADCFALELPSA